MPLWQVTELPEARRSSGRTVRKVRGKRGSSLRYLVLECGCTARLVLVDDMTAGCLELGHPAECGVCGERFVVSRVVPWVEERLEGEEVCNGPYSLVEKKVG